MNQHTKTVTVETKSDGVAHVTLNRPESRNAMNVELMEELTRTLETVAGDTSVRVVILTGAGKAFSVGGDLAEGAGGGVSDGMESSVARMRNYMRASELLITMPQITIAQINGACAGAGLSLACACDLRYSTPDAVFSTAFLSAGLPGDYGGTWTLSRIVGTSRARELFMLPDRFTAERAAELGILHGIEPSDNLAENVTEVANRLASSAPLALAGLKQNLNDALVLPLAELLDVEASRQMACADTDDAREAAQAFLEKRSPKFVGR